MLPSLSALRADGRSALAPVGQSVAQRAGARLFGKWLRRPQATGTRFYEQPGFDDYFNWCTSDNPDLGTAPEWYRSDKAAVLCAVEKDGMQLQYASAALRDDEQVVRLALMQNKAALGYASKKIKEKMQLEEAKARGEYTDEQLLKTFSTLQIMHDFVQAELLKRVENRDLNAAPSQ